jgi:hypothetical protein
MAVGHRNGTGGVKLPQRILSTHAIFASNHLTELKLHTTRSATRSNNTHNKDNTEHVSATRGSGGGEANDTADPRTYPRIFKRGVGMEGFLRHKRRGGGREGHDEGIRTAKNCTWAFLDGPGTMICRVENPGQRRATEKAFAVRARAVNSEEFAPQKSGPFPAPAANPEGVLGGQCGRAAAARALCACHAAGCGAFRF